MFLKLLHSLFNILNGDISTKQVAGGFAFGLIIGLTPTFSLHNLLVVLLICIIRVNVATVMFSYIIFGLISFLVNPISHQLGYLLLVRFEFLKSFWTILYNMPLIPLSGFNNTLLLGSLVISLILFYPAFMLSEKGLIRYRTSLKPKLDNTKFFKILRATKIYNWYTKIKNLTGS
jgi:uncharacterized protein (TIGR03546 family)